MAEENKVEENIDAGQEAPVDAPEGGVAEGPESIGLADLQLLANIVDLASQRGAFRGSELTQVGSVYDRLSQFLNFVAERQAEAQEGVEGEEAPAPEEGE